MAACGIDTVSALIGSAMLCMLYYFIIVVNMHSHRLSVVLSMPGMLASGGKHQQGCDGHHVGWHPAGFVDLRLA